MARQATPPELKDVSFSVAMPPDLLKFLGEQQKELGYKSVAEVIRRLSESMRSFFGLPPYMVELVRADMERRKLDWFQYVQTLIAERYETLRAEAQHKSKR